MMSSINRAKGEAQAIELQARYFIFLLLLLLLLVVQFTLTLFPNPQRFVLPIYIRALSLACKALAETVFKDKPNGGDEAAKYLLATDWVKQYGNIIGQSNTVVLNDNINDVAGMVAKAMGVMSSLSNNATISPDVRKIGAASVGLSGSSSSSPSTHH